MGAWFGGAGATVTVTSSLADSPSSSVTVKRKASAVSSVTAGAVKLADAVAAPVSCTEGPAVWVQAYLAIDPSMSAEDAPESNTSSPEKTFMSKPASATGGWFGAGGSTVTRMMSSSVAPSSSVTVSRNHSRVSRVTVGAVKVAVAWSAPFNATLGPTVWTHAKLAMVPSGSVDAVPESSTRSPEFTDRLGPASACGAWFGSGARTRMRTVSVPVAPSSSSTVRRIVRVESSATLGAVKLACAVSA